MANLVELKEKFSGKDEAECLAIYRDMLLNAGFECKDVQKGQNITSYYYRDDKDNLFVSFYSSNYSTRREMIIPRNFCVDELGLNSPATRSIILKTRNDKQLVPCSYYLDDPRQIPKYLHRWLFKYLGQLSDNNKSLTVDHITHHFGVCVPDELRLCTSAQNSRNRPDYRGSIKDEFTYDPLRDYSHSFYIPFLHYVLGIISKEDMRTLREMELQAELAA